MTDTATRPDIDRPLELIAAGRDLELAELGASPTADGWLVMAGEQLKMIAAASIEHRVTGSPRAKAKLRGAWARLGAQAAEAIAAIDAAE